jgi:hypothetical protein
MEPERRLSCGHDSGGQRAARSAINACSKALNPGGMGAEPPLCFDTFLVGDRLCLEGSHHQTACHSCPPRSYSPLQCPQVASVIVGSLSWRRCSRSFAFASGCSSSHRSTAGQVFSKGSTRVRHARGAVFAFRWIGRTSPAFQAVERLSTTSIQAGGVRIDVTVASQ